jgi:hypothetical protein
MSDDEDNFVSLKIIVNKICTYLLVSLTEKIAKIHHILPLAIPTYRCLKELGKLNCIGL